MKPRNPYLTDIDARETEAEYIINSIIEFDRLAGKKVEKAGEERDIAITQIEKQKEALKQQMTLRAQKKLDDYRASLDEEYDEQLKQAREHKEKIISKLDDAYNQHHEQWEKELFNFIIDEDHSNA